jgi:hypothetical protein
MSLNSILKILDLSSLSDRLAIINFLEQLTADTS